MQVFIKYLDTIKSHDLDKITEHSLRPALNELLETIAKELNPKIKIIHEHKREGKFGAPDFKVFETDNIIGYIENKKIDETIDKILKSDQIKKYKELSNNLLLTNYLDWIWLKNGEIQQRETLCSIKNLPDFQNLANLETKCKAIKDLINNYFSTAPQGISEPKILAHSLATRARILKDFLFDELEIQEKSENQQKLKGLYHTFKDFIFNDLTISEFSDAFAQTLTYGLFLAKLNMENVKTGHTLSLHTVTQYIPTSFQLIKELVDFLKELDNEEYKNTRWIVEEILTVMNTLDLRAIIENLSYSNKKNIPIKDPYVYFYEDFLAAYDQKLRKSKGVYYTPPPIVNFIVRAINQLLIDKFNIQVGLADHKRVTVLDFATGTGTFLVEILQQIFDTIQNSAKRELIVKQHILKNIYGFEYLIAPYTIAHLKLSQFLRDNNYKLTDKERFQVFLTNTLEPIDPQMKIPLLPALTQESRDAQEVKDKPILVITGNPPYSISSANKSIEILKLLKDYKIGLNEKSFVAMSDDYIKFIRFAHKKIEQSGEGVIAVITNNSYLDGAIHRKMREKIYNDFDIIYVLNLHGNGKTEQNDKNVFDIRVGVAILILVKLKKPLQEKLFYYYSTYENEIKTRDEKYELCLNQDINSLDWVKIRPQSPYFLFVKSNMDLKTEYEKFHSLKDIFNLYGSAVKTDNDTLCYNKDKEVLQNRMKKLFDFKFDDNFRKDFKVNDEGSFKVLSRTKKSKFDINSIKTAYYRPFDDRFLYYQNGFTSRPNFELNKHLLNNNLCLISGRAGNVISQNHEWNLAYVTDRLTDTNIFYRGGGFLFPLYLYVEKNIFEYSLIKTEKQLEKEYFEAELNFENAYREYQNAKNSEEKEEHIIEEYLAKVEEHKTVLEIIVNQRKFKNLEHEKSQFVKTNNFSDNFSKYISELYNLEFSPEQIFYYIYAILYSPGYRSKYAEFLKIDFPKIPFTSNPSDFKNLSDLGKQLSNAHLFEPEILNKIAINNKTGEFKGEGNYTIEKIQFAENKLFINNGQYFDNVSETIYNFQIGGYQVLYKYLKDNKELTLKLEEIEKIENIIRILEFTVNLMNDIDVFFNQLFITSHETLQVL